MTDALDDLYLDYLDSCDELGIDPSPSTAALYARILAQDSEIAPVSRDRASRGGAAPRPKRPPINNRIAPRRSMRSPRFSRGFVFIVGEGPGPNHFLPVPKGTLWLNARKERHLRSALSR